MWNDETAQVSAELIIVTAALVAVAIVLVMQLQNTAKKGSELLSDKAGKALDEIGNIK